MSGSKRALALLLAVAGIVGLVVALKFYQSGSAHALAAQNAPDELAPATTRLANEDYLTATCFGGGGAAILLGGVVLYYRNRRPARG